MTPKHITRTKQIYPPHKCTSKTRATGIKQTLNTIYYLSTIKGIGDTHKALIWKMCVEK